MSTTRNDGSDFESKYTKSGPLGSYLIDNFYRDLFDLMGQIEPTDIYECACGAGHSTQRIWNYLQTRNPTPRFRASDIDSNLVDRARERVPDISISTNDIYTVAESACHPDLVIALEVLEHLERPSDALAAIMQLTQRWALVSVPREPLWRCCNLARGAYIHELGNTPGHIQHWTSRSFVRFLRSAGQPRAIKKPLPWTMVLLEREN